MKGVTGHYRKGFLVLEVERGNAEYQGRVWKQLHDHDKRKFENLLVLTHPTERVKVLYL